MKKIENNFLYKNIKEFNKYLLILLAILFISITGLTSYAIFTTEVESSNTIQLQVAPYNPEDYIWAYEYTGSYQEFKVLKTGYYEVELWGAKGGNSILNIDGSGSYVTGGRGTYSKGTILMNKGETYYIYVGQMGCFNTEANAVSFNGGGKKGTGNQQGGCGGGATDIRYFEEAPTNTELEWNNITGLGSRIMVAAGGGGASNWTNSRFGAHGGLLNGGLGNLNFSSVSHTLATGGTQIRGGTGGGDSGLGTPGTFGIGGNSYPNYGGGGGGGYYGGGGGGSTSNGVSSGASGSSYISGYAGVISITSATNTNPSYTTKHYSGKYFIYSSMENDGLVDGIANDGPGKAKITYMGNTASVKTNTKLNNVRYIKSCINGSEVSATNTWIEIQAIKDGENIAKGKSVTGTVPDNGGGYAYTNITNGNMQTIVGSNQGISSVTGLQCVTVDLGNIYNLDEVTLWLFWADGRTYKHNTLSVGSTNPGNSTTTSLSTILHNLPAGYAETSQGRRYTAWD